MSITARDASPDKNVADCAVVTAELPTDGGEG